MTFERLMSVYEVPQNRWAYKLAPQLTGRAQQAYAAMPSEEAGNYASVKAAILRRYDISEETYRQKFRNTVPTDNETYRELAVRVMDLLQKWMKDHRETVQDVLEQVALEQLMSTLPREVSIWVQEKKPRTAIEAGQLADEYMLVRQRSIGPRQGGHQLTENSLGRERIRCNYCSKQGHLARDCRKAKSDQLKEADKEKPNTDGDKPKADKSKIKCYNCKEMGHFASNCPSKPVLFSAVNHRKKPSRSACIIDAGVSKIGQVEGKSVDIVLDTGCARTMVRKDLVKPSKITDRQVSIHCAHGSSVAYPLAKVKIAVGDSSYEVEAAISDQLPVPVLLGRDVPELLEMLRKPRTQSSTLESDQEGAWMTTTRSQWKKQTTTEIKDR